MTALVDRLRWMDSAACIGQPLRVFFPVGGPTDEARRVCESCSVAVSCAEYAAHVAVIGVWGSHLIGYDVEPEDAEPLKVGGPDRKTAATTTDAEEATTMPQGKSTVSAEGTARCSACRKQMSVRKFPTVKQSDGAYVRNLAECRECRNARRAATREAKQADKQTTKTAKAAKETAA